MIQVEWGCQCSLQYSMRGRAMHAQQRCKVSRHASNSTDPSRLDVLSDAAVSEAIRIGPGDIACLRMTHLCEANL